MGVPIFLFLSGALLLPRTYSGNALKSFYRKNVLSLVITLETWLFIYWMMGVIVNGVVDFSVLFKMLTFQERPTLLISNIEIFDNYWYMPMIIGVYMVLPFVAKVLSVVSLKDLRLLSIFVMVLGFVIPTINYYLSATGVEPIKSVFTLDNVGSIYIWYIISGYAVLYKRILKSIKSWWIGILFISCAVLCISLMRMRGGDVWYNGLGLLVCCACGCELIMRAVETLEKFNEQHKDRGHWPIAIVEFLSKTSLGLYFVHVVILGLCMVYYVPSSHLFIDGLVLFLLSSVISCVCVGIIFACGHRQKTSWISKLLLRVSRA